MKFNRLYVERQTMLFSATQTNKVEDLAKLALDKAPMYIGVQEDSEYSTVSFMP